MATQMVDCGQIALQRPFETGRVTAADCTGLPDEVTEGSTVEATVTVSNDNAEAATADVAVSVAGQTVGSTTVSVGANGQQQATVSADLSGIALGTYSPDASVVGATAAQPQEARADGGRSRRGGLEPIPRRTGCTSCGGH